MAGSPQQQVQHRTDTRNLPDLGCDALDHLHPADELAVWEMNVYGV